MSAVSGAAPDSYAARTWERQRVWSQTAGRLKGGIVRARLAALLLGIVAAATAVMAVQLADVQSAVARTFGFLAAVAAGLTPLVLRGASTERVSDWTRVRSAAEGLKSELLEYLAGGTDYTAADAGPRLAERTRDIDDGLEDLLPLALTVDPDGKEMPAVHDVTSYVDQRVRDQIDTYYRPKAKAYHVTVVRLRRIGIVLAAAGVVLAAGAAVGGPDQLAAWVPVVTTVAASLTAHIAASRYDHQIVEFLRTARQLERLLDKHAAGTLDDGELVDACERIISVENQAWLTNWSKSG